MKKKHSERFGDQAVNASIRKEKIQQIFHNVATNYDLMNNIMSFGMHHFWKNEMVKEINAKPNDCLIDVASGTCDIALKYLKSNKKITNNKVTICDINTSMIFEGKNLATNNGFIKNINWITCDASHMPIKANTFNTYTISFGLRNVTHIERSLKEAYRILKINGKFLCLEFSTPSNPLTKTLHSVYLKKVIPLIGKKITNNKEAYQYLSDSIQNFMPAKTLITKIKQAGFKKVTQKIFNNGICTLYIGYK